MVPLESTRHTKPKMKSHLWGHMNLKMPISRFSDDFVMGRFSSCRKGSLILPCRAMLIQVNSTGNGEVYSIANKHFLLTYNRVGCEDAFIVHIGKFHDQVSIAF